MRGEKWARRFSSSCSRGSTVVLPRKFRTAVEFRVSPMRNCPRSFSPRSRLARGFTPVASYLRSRSRSSLEVIVALRGSVSAPAEPNSDDAPSSPTSEINSHCSPYKHARHWFALATNLLATNPLFFFSSFFSLHLRKPISTSR